MKAIVHTRYGSPDVLELREVQRPEPRGDEVLIRVHATSVTSADCFMRRAETPMGRLLLGLRRPRREILGTELAGEVEAAGQDVKRFKKGDKVYGFTGFGLGAYAEYCCMSEKGSLVLKPATTSYAEAASVIDGASTALFFLRDKGNIQRGEKVLILGASGSIGAAAVQFAGYFGADVTGVCSKANAGLVESLGADRVIDYVEQDFTRNGETYDIIFDAVGKESFSHCKGSLKENGRYLRTVGTPIHYLQMIWTSLVGGRKILCGMSIDKTDALVFIKDLMEAGSLKPVIDRCYPLGQIAEAHRYVEKGHKKGNVVICVVDP